MKKYWLVKGVYIKKMNVIFGSDWSDNAINRFYLSKAIYLTYDSDMTKCEWGFMEYPEYDSAHDETNKIMRPSTEWLKEYNYEYQGEFSRKTQLQKLNLYNEDQYQ